MVTVAQHVEGLKGGLNIMRALELQGRVEAARLTDAAAVVSLFDTMAEQVDSAYREMDELLRINTFSFDEDRLRAQQSHEQGAVLRRMLAAFAED